MVWSHVRPTALLEIAVVLFQLFGVVALYLSRLLPASRWAARGKVGFVVALVGLGIAGALCGRLDSEFSLFAGGTMTALLIGMTLGSGSLDSSLPPDQPTAPEHALAA